LLPPEIKPYFSFLPGASLWNLYGKDIWGTEERKEFLLVDIDGPTREQLAGFVEPHWDLSSYPKFEPMDRTQFEYDLVSEYYRRGGALRQINPDEIEEMWMEYIRSLARYCSIPATHLKKRRMCVQLDVLESKGVDLEKMLDRNLTYVPDVEITLTDCWDKMKVRKIDNSDKLRLIEPILKGPWNELLGY
jgi:hypothetical protein